MTTAIQLLNDVKALKKKLQNIGVSVKHRLEYDYKINIDDVVNDEKLSKSVRKLFEDGHHAEAVEKAYKFLNNLVKKRANLTPSRDGADLMKKTFSANSPILRLNAGVTKSEQDEQLGYMEIFAGVMTGIRNPRAHEDEWEDQEYRALQLLMLADHLVDRVRNSVKEA